MKVAAAMQAGFRDQRRRDHLALLKFEYRRHCTTLTCDRSRFWRGRYDQAMDEIADLHAQMRARGMTPRPRRDGQQAGLRVTAG